MAHFGGHLGVPQRCLERRGDRAVEISLNSTKGRVHALSHGVVGQISCLWAYSGVLAETLGVGAHDTVGLAANVFIEIKVVRRQFHPLYPSEVLFYLKFILDELLRQLVRFFVETVINAAGVKCIDPVCDQKGLVE